LLSRVSAGLDLESNKSDVNRAFGHVTEESSGFLRDENHTLTGLNFDSADGGGTRSRWARPGCVPVAPQ